MTDEATAMQMPHWPIVMLVVENNECSADHCTTTTWSAATVPMEIQNQWLVSESR